MISVAVIGCGQWGPNHIRNFSNLPGARIVAAVDTDAARLERIRDVFHNIDFYSDYRRALDDARVNAVVIATPLRTHYHIVREALLASKHVLCEKPLCEASEEAQELVALAQERKLVLMVGHVFLFNPGIVKVKELVDGGELGQLRFLSAIRTNLGPVRNDCNAAFDLASHDISIFNWLLGREPILVSAAGASFLQPGIEDVVSISLKYPDNVFASIQGSWLNPKKVRQITVVGSRKMLTWDDLDLSTPVASYDKGANSTQEYSDYGDFLRISMWEGEVRLPRIRWEEPLKVQARCFMEAIERGHIERSDGKFALGVVRVLTAINTSLKNNGSPVRLTT